MAFNEITYLFAYAISGLLIGFVGGMVGLVLGVVRFPIVLGAETTAANAEPAFNRPTKTVLYSPKISSQIKYPS